MLEWIGASVIAPRPQTPIEFEIASVPGVRTGYFRESMFYSLGDPAGYPRKLIRRWRYLGDSAVRNDFACAIST
jgi:hypothetical protein